MMKIRNNNIIALLIFFSNYLLAQEPAMPSIIKPSPNAASLGAYGEYKVSNYTGIPGISIPLYTVKSGDIELPISLSYNASGVKVTNEASWVGLGWALNAGGVITRQVMKYDDFKENVGYAMGVYTFPQIDGYYTAAGNYYPGSMGGVGFPAPYGYPDTEFMYGGAGGKDTEPDIYSYNFLGYSGKLLIKIVENGVYRAIPEEQNNLDFIYHRDIKQWEVTDVRGWKYFFGTTEVSITSTQGAVIIPDTESVETAWYIDKIVTPKGDKIDFVYAKNTGYTTNFGGVSEDNTYERFCGLTGIIGFFQNAYGNSVTKSYSRVKEVSLSKITFNEGSVIFNTNNENRLDRLYDWQAVPPKALNNISIYDNTNNKIEDILFKTSYFNQSQSAASDKEMYLRLKLDEVVFFPSSFNPQSTKLQYSTVALPRKDSYSIDQWGYYNGANNLTIQPYENSTSYGQDVYGELSAASKSLFSTIIPYYYHNASKILVIGANRDTNKDYIQAGLLNSISYPTGGKTKFEFEPNEYRTKGNGYYNLSPEIITSTSNGISENSFTTTRSTFVLLEYEFDNAAYYESDPFLYNKVLNTNVILEKQDGTKIIKFFPSKRKNSDYFNNSTRSYISVSLDPGTYKLKANNGGYMYFNIKLRAKILRDGIGFTTKIGGGVRIKSIQNYDGAGNVFKKNFTYLNDDGNSSGKLMSDVFNFYNDTQILNFYGRVYTPNYIWDAENTLAHSFVGLACWPLVGNGFGSWRDIKAFSSSVVPEGSSAGGQAIGYSQVTVKEINPFPFATINNLGKSVYTYKNVADTQLGWFLPNLKEYEHNDNGQLLTEKHYDSEGKILNEKINEYTAGTTYSIKGFRILSGNFTKYCGHWIVGGGCNPNSDVPYNRFYKKEVTWWYPSRIIERTYPSGGGTPIETTQDFTYNNLSHKQLTQEQTIFPDVTVQKTYSYADETGNQLMKDRNMIGIPLVSETQKTINGTAKTLQKVETYYPKDASETTSTNGLALPLWTKTYGLDNLTTPNTFLTYDKYDSKGNILQYSEKGIKPTSFIWGYNQTLPIAKIEGISYDALMAISGISTAVNSIVSKSDIDQDQATENDLIVALDAFRTNSNLANYQISTYTYDPMIGLTSVTPPSGAREIYKYDDNNRLSEVKDINGNILKENKYNYSNGMAEDVSIASISGPDNIELYSTYPTTGQYTFNTQNMPNDLYYSWWINPTYGVTTPIPYNSPTVSVTFSTGGQYKLNFYTYRASGGETVTLSKTINVNYIYPPVYGSPNFTALPNIQIMSSGIYLSGTTVSGYFVFKPGMFSGTKDFALISSDKAPSADKSVNFHEVSTGIDRQWTFIFKTTGVVSASYTGTPLTNDSVINVSTFQYQK